MPGPVPGAGPIPPQLAGPPGPTGAVATPQPQAGQSAGAMSSIRNALVDLQKALPGIPMGSQLHAAILKAVESISKHIDSTDTAPNKGVDIQQLAMRAREMSQASPQAALLKAISGGQGGAPHAPVMGAAA